MKLPTGVKDVIFDSSGAFSVLDLYSYLRSHKRVVPYDAQTRITVSGENFGAQPSVWDGNLNGTARRISDLGYAGAVAGDLFVSPLTIDGWTFPVDPLISVSGANTIVQTQMSDGAGPVVEEVASEGYLLTIRGMLINEDNDDYPFDQVARLHNMRSKMGGLEIKNNIINRCYGIDRIVIRNLMVPAEEGVQSMQAFTITAVSDRDVQLELKEGWS